MLLDGNNQGINIEAAKKNIQQLSMAERPWPTTTTAKA
jgi:hypothetical protein